MRTYPNKPITELPENGIFVFGSNTQGRHGKGAALIARTKFGAIYGQSRGFQGKSYAICTKDLTKSIHPSVHPDLIEKQLWVLYSYVKENPHLDFYIAYGITPNLNGYSPQEMADLFSRTTIPENVIFNEEFAKLLRIK